MLASSNLFTYCLYDNSDMTIVCYRRHNMKQSANMEKQTQK